jgi:hypothetical protein
MADAGHVDTDHREDLGQPIGRGGEAPDGVGS